MGTYDRALQWRMMQQRHPHSSLTSNPYFASGYSALGTTGGGERRSTSLQSLCSTNNSNNGNNTNNPNTNDPLAAGMASTPTGTNYYPTDDRPTASKRQRLSKHSPRGASASSTSMGGPQRANALASYLPSANEYSTYPPPPPPTQESSNEWFSQRSSAMSTGSAGLTVNTANSYASSNENSGTMLNRQSSLVSPTTIFGMENLMADYESGFYSLWNGPNGANVMGYDTEATTPTDRPSSSSSSHVYLPEEELKMDYPQLPDLNQGDLDYIYGSMDQPTTRNSEGAHMDRSYGSMETSTHRGGGGGLKRDRSNDDAKLGMGLMSPTQTSLISPLAPSGFRNLARTTSIETKRPAPPRLQLPYGGGGGGGGGLEVPHAATPLGTAPTRRPLTTSSAGSSASAKRPRSRQCDFPGCENRARSHQKCKKHGGAHQCVYEGCQKNSQSRGLCIAHGGGSRCKVDGCTRASQSKGRCKSHGGGEYCAVEGCRKKAHLKHLCRTHGGGVRCKDPKCMKWAQRKGWCMAHAKEVLGT